MNARMWPSGDKAGVDAESVKSVSCVYLMTEGWGREERYTTVPMMASPAKTPAASDPPSRSLFTSYRRCRGGALDLYGNFGLQRPGSISHRSDKAVANPRDGFDVARRGCRVTQGVAELLDGLVQSVVKVDKDVRGPKALLKFVASEYLTGAFEQDCQDLQWLLGQPQFRPIPAQLSGFEIELKEAKANYILGRRNRHSRILRPPARTEFSIRRLRPVSRFYNYAWTGDNFA